MGIGEISSQCLMHFYVWCADGCTCLSWAAEMDELFGSLEIGLWYKRIQSCNVTRLWRGSSVTQL